VIRNVPSFIVLDLRPGLFEFGFILRQSCRTTVMPPIGSPFNVTIPDTVALPSDAL
jgi:hypothetical protein